MGDYETDSVWNDAWSSKPCFQTRPMAKLSMRCNYANHHYRCKTRDGHQIVYRVTPKDIVYAMLGGYYDDSK